MSSSLPGSAEADETPAVRVEQLCVDMPSHGRPYAAPLHAVRGLSFTVPAGQVTALVGANGAGKTTALRAVLGAVPFTAGRLEVLGIAMGPADVAVPAQVAAVPDAPAYPSRWTAPDLARAHRATAPHFDDARFEAYLTEHQVPLTRPVGGLSRGQLTQLAVGAALARGPRLLLLDEPFARLDPLARTELVDSLRELMTRPDRTILLSTHDLEGMDRFVDRLVVIARGMTVLEGDVETLREEFLLLELPGAPVPAMIGAVTTAGTTRGLVHVEEAAGLPPMAALQRPGIDDLVTHWLRATDPGSAAAAGKETA